MSTKNPNTNLAELRQIAWDQLGIRLDHGVTAEHIHALLQYQSSDIPMNEVDAYRDEIIAFIKKHPNRLSMPCDGNCYQHDDGVVIHCYANMKEDIENG